MKMPLQFVFIRSRLAVLGLASCLLSSVALAAPLDIGAALPDFSLRNVNGSSVSTRDFASAKVLVVVFSCNTCPYSRAYQARLVQLHKTFGGRGVQFIVVNPNDVKKSPGDSFAAMQKLAEQAGYLFPYVHDESQQVARTFGASRTPEAFVFDQKRRLIYRGQIDDNTEEAQVRTSHLKNALDNALAGTSGKINPSTTRAFGCTIKWRE